MTNRPKQIIHTLVLHPQISVDNAAPMSDHEHPVAAPSGQTCDFSHAQTPLNKAFTAYRIIAIFMYYFRLIFKAKVSAIY